MRPALLIAFAAGLACCCLGGCSPQASFVPETIPVNNAELGVKGWTEKDDLHVELRLRKQGKGVSLHNVCLVDAAGGRHGPTKWVDKTPEPPKINVGVGFGIPLGGGGGGGGADCPDSGGSSSGGGSGSGMGITPGIGIPVPLGKKDGVTAIDASWKLDESTSQVTDCTLEVSLVATGREKIEVTTVPLAMTCAADKADGTTAGGGEGASVTVATTQPADEAEEKAAPPQKPEPQKTAAELVREINFTLKSPPTTRTLET